MKFIIPTKKSREVKFKDIWRVLFDGTRIKIAMLSPFEGLYPFASSVSHCQITDTDPLRFFVVDKEGGISDRGVRLRNATRLSKYFGARIIINPEIIDTGKKIIYNNEACMSISDKPRKIGRYENITMKYWTFFGPKIRKFYLYRACLIQHEIDHFDNITYHNRYFKK